MADQEKGKWFLTMFLVMVFVTLAIAFAIAVWVPGEPTLKLRLAITYGLLILIFLFGFVVLAAIASDKIDISELLEEDTGGASTSRFQLLIFTFVIGLSFVLIVACNCKLPDVPTNVLALLGISASTYGVSKGIQAGVRNGNTANSPGTVQKDGSTGTSGKTT
jgi:hypothetical protein